MSCFPTGNKNNGYIACKCVVPSGSHLFLAPFEPVDLSDYGSGRDGLIIFDENPDAP
jgi:hypothetical protein